MAGPADGRVVPPTFLHDLNNLLTAIHGYSTMLAGDLPEGGTEREFASRILAAAEEARQLVASVPRAKSRSDEIRVLLVGGATARLAGALETLGLEVTLAATPREAQAALKSNDAAWQVVAAPAETLDKLETVLPRVAIPAGADAVTVDGLIRAAAAG
ncbi:MAG: hypothetical protein PW843_20805 [Azospirillaceae bacterium]|nr:hypothetical protein [Azospirillaceae bacterium]